MKNVANTFRKIYKKTGNSGSDADYELIANVGVNGIDLDLMKGATTELDGEIGLVPKPSAGTINRYLRCDGTWSVPPDTNTTYNLSSFGITATAAEINKLDGLTASKIQLNFLDGATSNIQTQINSINNKIKNIGTAIHYKKYRVTSNSNRAGKQYVYTTSYNNSTYVPSGGTFLFAHAVMVSGNTDYCTALYSYGNSAIAVMPGTGSYTFDVYVFYKI